MDPATWQVDEFFHGPALLRTQKTFGKNFGFASVTKPLPCRNPRNAITGLVYGHIAAVAINNLIVVVVRINIAAHGAEVLRLLGVLVGVSLAGDRDGAPVRRDAVGAFPFLLLGLACRAFWWGFTTWFAAQAPWG